MKEIRQHLMKVITINLSVVAKEHYITINKIIFANIFVSTCNLSQFNKVVILPQPFNQHFHNIYKSKYIS